MRNRFQWRAKHDVDPELNPVHSTSMNEPLLHDPISRRDDLSQELLFDRQKEAGPGWLHRIRGSLRVRVSSPLKWNQRTVTINMEKEVIRVVVFKGKNVVAWRTTDLSQEHSPGNSEEPSPGEDDSASRLQSALDELGIKYGGRFWKLVDKVGIRRGRVVMDLSLYTTLMRHLQIPKVRVRYLEPVVVSEVLESLPFNKDEVDITW